MDVRDKIFIGGEWVPSKGSGTIEVINSATEEVMGTIPNGSPEDVDLAARAAADAFYNWSTTSVDERAKTAGRPSSSPEATAIDPTTPRRIGSSPDPAFSAQAP